MKSIRFNDTINEFVEIIDKNISAVIPKNTELQLYDAFQYIFEGGGKRIRPIITMACAGVAGANPMLSLNAAIAIEIIHNFTLVHDDIMDKSPLRRKRETIHKKWNSDIAILSGDILIGWAFRILNQSKQFSDSSINSELNLALSNAIIEVCEGQELDMRFNTQSQVKITEYIEMIKLKTSSLLRCAAKLGAIVAKSPKITLFALDRFAENFGIAFQIQDDILDFSATNKKFGKKIGQDLVGGKKSFPIVKAFELATDQEDVDLLNLYFNSPNGLSEEYIPKFITLFKKLDIFDIAQNEIIRYFDIAKICLSDIENNEYNELLCWILASYNNRTI